MRVEEIMESPVITASMDARIDTVLRMFEDPSYTRGGQGSSRRYRVGPGHS